MPKLEYVTPILCVADVTASIAYYRERLGFETTFTLGRAGHVRRGAARRRRGHVLPRGAGQPGHAALREN
jgi:hypothetical protein